MRSRGNVREKARASTNPNTSKRYNISKRPNTSKKPVWIEDPCIIYDSQKEQFIDVKGRRFKFHPDTIRKFNENNNGNNQIMLGEQDICHRVSFDLMRHALINAANYYIARGFHSEGGLTPQKEAICGVIGIIRAVTGAFSEPIERSEAFINDFIDSEDEKLKDYQEPVKKLMDIFMRESHLQNSKNDRKDVEASLNEILYRLNNEMFNLRKGSASVNDLLAVRWIVLINLWWILLKE